MIDHTPILEATCQFFHAHLTTDHRELLATKYGFSQRTIDDHRIGYATGDVWKLPEWLLNQGFPESDIRASGLVWIPDDNSSCGSIMRGRIMFPYCVNAIVHYFIGRQTDDTPQRREGQYTPKYQKMKTQKDDQGNIITPIEPVFGVDTVRQGLPLIITEGIADCISAHQAGYAAISPGTIRFKENHVNEVQKLCKTASKTYIIMDNEENEAGLHGAIDTGLKLCRRGILPFLATIPRTDAVHKIDLNDYIREGGDVSDLFATAAYVEDHPRASEIIRNEWKHAAEKMAHRVIPSNQQTKVPNGDTTYYDIDELKSALPRLRDIIGFEGRGRHPVYGSSSGQNLAVSDGVWCCYHQGHEGGGDVLKWIACYELHLIHESDELRGDEFMKTCHYAAQKYMPTPSNRLVMN